MPALCDLRASDFMKLRRVTVDRVIEEVIPRKSMSKSLNTKLLKAGNKARLLSKLKPQHLKPEKDNVRAKSTESNNQPPPDDGPVAVKLATNESNQAEEDPLNKKINQFRQIISLNEQEKKQELFIK